MTLKIKAPAPAYEGTAYVQTTVKGAEPKLEEHKIEGQLPQVGQQLAEPSLSLGVTMNTGNFTSVRVDVGIRLPCEPENVDATYDEMRAWVDERVNAIMEETKEAYGTING